MIETAKLTDAEASLLREALLYYRSVLDRNDSVPLIPLVDSAIAWRRFLASEIIDMLLAR